MTLTPNRTLYLYIVTVNTSNYQNMSNRAIRISGINEDPPFLQKVSTTTEVFKVHIPTTTAQGPLTAIVRNMTGSIITSVPIGTEEYEVLDRKHETYWYGQVNHQERSITLFKMVSKSEINGSF